MWRSRTGCWLNLVDAGIQRACNRLKALVDPLS
jgi:hypothetical protein